jgi:hypothetical protein
MFYEVQFIYHDSFYYLFLVTKTGYKIVEFILYLYDLQ